MVDANHISSGFSAYQPSLMLAADKIEGYTPVMRAGVESPPLTPGTLQLNSRQRWVAFLRVTAFVILGLIAMFVAGFGAFSTYVGNLATPDAPKADAIIVLTGGQARLDTAWHLLEGGKGKRLLISGVNPSTGRNQLRAAVGADPKLFSCCVDFDYDALDTIGNATGSAEWLRKHNFHSAILVTQNYHMPRSLMELSRRTDAELTPYPVVNTPLGNMRWLTESEALRVLFFEYTKFLVSAAGGDLTRVLNTDATPVRH